MATGPAQWQPIETAPKDGTPILVAGKWNGVYRVRWVEGIDATRHDWTSRWRWFVYEAEDGYYSWSFDEDELTHWMPLPAPPEAPDAP